MVHRRTARFVFGKFDRFNSVHLMISELGWSSLLERVEWAKLKVIFKVYTGFRSWEEITNRFQEPSYLGRADYRKKIRKILEKCRFTLFGYFFFTCLLISCN